MSVRSCPDCLGNGRTLQLVRWQAPDGSRHSAFALCRTCSGLGYIPTTEEQDSPT